VQPLWKSIWRLLKKLKIDLPYDSTIPLTLEHIQRRVNQYKKDTYIPMFIAALFTIAKSANQPING
jgi:hypothetical protein